MTFKKRAVESTEAEVKTKGHQCEAYGCPLVGSTLNNGQQFCYWHARQKFKTFPAVTKAINEHIWLYQLWLQVDQPNLFFTGTEQFSFFQIAAAEAVKTIKKMKRDDLLPTITKNRYGISIDENSNYGAWAIRLFDAFNSEITKAIIESESSVGSQKVPTNQPIWHNVLEKMIA